MIKLPSINKGWMVKLGRVRGQVQDWHDDAATRQVSNKEKKGLLVSSLQLNYRCLVCNTYSPDK